MTDQNQQDEAPGQTIPFADVLQSLDKGRTHTELSTKLQQLVAAVEDTGKKGSISITLTVAPSKSEAPFEVIEAIGLKLPAATRRASLFYADDDHNLVRRDPRQAELPLGPRDLSATNRKAQ